MKYQHILSLLATFALSLFLSSCGKDYDGDIEKLNTTHDNISKRIDNLETKVTALNNQLSQLAVLATAAEQNFYVTQVLTTTDGYELTLSNGQVIVLQNLPGNLLTPMPSVSMTNLNGFFYWTLNGVMFTDADGKPIRTTDSTPLVKYDYTLNEWLISIDGGLTFKDINTYVSFVINDQVLLQVINNFISQHQTTLFSQQMLYQIISSYIQQNYREVFNIEILNEVVANYVNKHYTRIFNYELLEKIFTQYNFEYIKENIKVEELVNVIVTFIREHQEIFMNNEVLYEIVSNYMEVNQTTLFTEDILLQVINNFIENNQNYIDIELLTRVVTNYIDQHRDIVFDTDVVRTLLKEYVSKYYVQVFSQNILLQIVNNYVTQNSTIIFNRTLIEEILNNYVTNNYTNIFSTDMYYEIVNNYVKMYGKTIIDRELLIKVITSYFSKNYNLFIDQTLISTAINNYIEQHSTTIIDVDIISSIVRTFITENYRTVFDIDILSQLIYNYFETHKEVITYYVNESTSVITNVKVSNDICTIDLRGGQQINLVVYDAMARLRDRVQSIVAMPDANGHFVEQKPITSLNYLVTPASMADIIYKKYYNKEINLEFKVTDGNGNVSTLEAWEPIPKSEGVLNISVGTTNANSTVKAIALHVSETKKGGTDIMTEFTIIDSEQQKGYLKCPDNNHPHMINLNLPSGTLWSCCNVGASTPEAYGGYYAWGETWTKDNYSLKSYNYCNGTSYNGFIDIGSDIAGTSYDVAHTIWKESWVMPNRNQLTELIENCTGKWTTKNNVNGCEFTGSNGATIFLPASGWYYDTNLVSSNYLGGYRSSTLASTPTGYTEPWTYILVIDQKTQSVEGNYDLGIRFYGLPVRPVAKP